jgi:hypothetical protein
MSDLRRPEEAFTKRTIFIHTIKSREGQAEQKDKWARMPVGKGSGAESVVGNWNKNRGGAARTEREQPKVCNPTVKSANSCPETGIWKDPEYVLHLASG